MKIFVNRKIVNGPWGGGNKFVQALFSHATKLGHEVVNTWDDDIDVIHLQDVHSDSLGASADMCLRYKKYNPKVKIVHRVNDMDLGRYGSKPWRDDAYVHYSGIFDASIFVSEWTKQFFLDKGWKCISNYVATNGVDKDIFKPMEKINNNKINIVTHHWSDNKGKGFDIYEAIDRFLEENDDFTFTYIGRERGTFKNSIVVAPLSGPKLGQALGKHDVYVSASEYENCPNHILESLACKIPTYAISSGGASVGIVGDNHIFNNWEDLRKILLLKKFSNNKYSPPSWKECIEKYCSIYQLITNGEKNGIRTRNK